MTPKEYLKQARCLDVRINNKLEQLACYVSNYMSRN